MVEILDLYDENRNLVGKTIERGQVVPDGCFCNVVHLCLFNLDKQLLCQKRSHLKKGMAGYWDVTVGGCVIAGETNNQAIEREAKEEIGLDVDFSKFQPIFTLKSEISFDDYYFLIGDVDINALTLQKEEVDDVGFFSFSQINEMVENDQFINYGHLSLIKEIADELFKQIK